MTEQTQIEITEESLSVGHLIITENNKNWDPELKAKHDVQERSRIYSGLRDDDFGQSAVLVGAMATPELAERAVLCLKACEGIGNQELGYAAVATIISIGVAQREIAVKTLEGLRDELTLTGAQLDAIEDAILRARGLKKKTTESLPE